MFLEIQNVDNLDLDGFVEWIINDIRRVHVSLPSRNQKLEENILALLISDGQRTSRKNQ